MPVDPHPFLHEVLAVGRGIMAERRIRIHGVAQYTFREPHHGDLWISPASLYSPAVVISGLAGLEPPVTWARLMRSTAAWETDSTPTSAWLLDAARPLPKDMLRSVIASSGRNLLLDPAWSTIRPAWMRDWSIHCPVRRGTAPHGAHRWRITRSTYLGLLRSMDLIVAPPGPLLWDAMRLGLATCDADGKPHPLDALAPLNHGVPAGLATTASWWRTLGEVPVSDWPDQFADWRRVQAVTLLKPPGGGQGLIRKVRKLVRDPVLFCADSSSPWLRRLVKRKLRAP
jgi:hypothetical protein